MDNKKSLSTEDVIKYAVAGVFTLMVASVVIDRATSNHGYSGVYRQLNEMESCLKYRCD